jgi:hypothetical protein
MKAYGTEKMKWFWRGDDFGPSSKHRKITSKNRRTSRRALHKKARANSREELFNQKMGL